MVEKGNMMLYAIAEIDGETKEIYRKKEPNEEPPYVPIVYDSIKIKELRNSIGKWEHLTISELNRIGLFYSDELSFLKLYLPEVVCEIIKKDYNINTGFIFENGDYIIFSEEYGRDRGLDRFNKHFNRNANFNRTKIE